MKATALILLAMMILFTGCNWMRLLEFRSQLKRFSEFAYWEDREWGRTLVFSDPLLNLADLQGFSLSPKPISPSVYAIKYRYRIDGTEVTGATEMLFLMKHDKLGGICFPSVMVNMVGQTNVEGFLRMAGGDSTSKGTVGDVSKDQVLRAIFGPSTPPIDDRKVVIILTPQDEVNRELRIEFEEGRKAGVYSRLSLIVGKARQPSSESGGAR